jgi:hypothetical protein
MITGSWNRPRWTKSMHSFRRGKISDVDDNDMFETLIQPAYFDSQLRPYLNILKRVFVDRSPGDFEATCLSANFFDSLMGMFMTNNQMVHICHAPSTMVLEGTALYTTYCMLNHSCRPSIHNDPFLLEDGSEGVGVNVFASSALKQNEEIFTSYLHSAGRSRRERKKKLSSYLFECSSDCPMCSSEPLSDSDSDY